MYSWIDSVCRALAGLLIATSLSISLCITAYAAMQPWNSLTSKQQEALAPISPLWATLPEIQQKRLLATTKGFHQLSPEKKQVFHKRLIEWSKLTPEQRNRAREKYKAFKKISPDKREEVKRMVLQQEAEKEKARQAAEEAQSTTNAAEEENNEDEESSND